MKDGIYLGTSTQSVRWVAEVDFSITLQANDLTKPDTLQSTYAYSIRLPDTLAIRDLLSGAEQLDAGGEDPYQLLPAHIVQDGEVVFRGLARLTEFEAGWKVELDEAKKSLFDELAAKSLRDLDLSRLDHIWDIEHMSALNKTSADVFYPLVDYGTMKPNEVAYDALFPAVSALTLLNQMFTESGYNPVGIWPQDPLLMRLAVPFVEEEPTAHDQDWIDARSAKVGNVQNKVYRTETDAAHKRKVDEILKATLDSGPGWFIGKQNNYNPKTLSYTADGPMRLRVQGYQEFKAFVHVGAPEVILQAEVNGVPKGETGYWSHAGPYNEIKIAGLQKIDRVTLDTTVLVNKGDVVKVRLIVQSRTKVGKWEIDTYQDPDRSFVGFTPDGTIHSGDVWPVAGNLPDLSCLALMKTVAFLVGGWWNVNEMHRSVELNPLTETVSDAPTDWSDRINEAVEPRWTPKIEPYGQKNNLKWAELAGVTKGYGDGIVSCSAQTLEASVDLFTLPFAATEPGRVEVAGYGAPLKIQTRTTTGTGSNVTITNQSTTPRLILVERGQVFEVPTKKLVNGAITETSVSLMGCWFGVRPNVLATSENRFSLCFDPVSFTEQSLIQRYYRGLYWILRRPRTLTLSMMLHPADVAGNDLSRPIKLKLVRIGSIDIGSQNFYINQIRGYSPGYPCEVTLIAY